jgi:hypothetical protein
MFDKEIEFSAHEDYFNQKQDYPVPIKLNIPEWYKKLSHKLNNQTIKGCMPFLDSLTTGYLLKIPQDILLHHNKKHEGPEENLRCSLFEYALYKHDNFIKSKYINLNSTEEFHNTKQLEGSPFVEKNKNFAFYKILNPWRIKTPKGYSCLFVPPLNNSDDRFHIISGIVDTDVFENEINFPIVINGDKYPELETTIKKGTPYVQVIPFKRDNWKMKFSSVTEKHVKNSRVFYQLSVLNNYKENFWKKKSWK